MTTSTPDSKKDDVSGPMLEPSFVNTPWARTAATAAAVAAAAGSSVLLPANLAAFAHLSSWAVYVGTNLYNTFVVGLTLFKNLPRQTFGRVQSKLFPKYFNLTTGSGVVMLATLPLLSVAATTTTKAVLATALGASVVNHLIFEPMVTKLMFARYDIENKATKTEEDQAAIKTLYKKFGMWHGISSMFNLVGFCAAVYHGWFLSQPFFA